MRAQSSQALPFEASGTTAIQAAAEWLSLLAGGSLAVALSVIAIAVLGLLMFGGRLPVRAGLRIVLGSFILLGAPLIAAGLIEFGEAASDNDAIAASAVAADRRAPLPASTYDPYAGASLRQD